MAILAIVVGPEIKRQHYELLRKEVGWDRNPPEGMIMHAASFDTLGGIRVADVWTSKEAMEKFFDTRLLPAMKKLNIPAPTEKETYPLYAAVAHAGIEEYRAKQLAR